MRTEGQRQSRNIEDRRGMRSAPMLAGGGLGTLIIVIIVMLLGGNPQPLLQKMKQVQQQAPAGGADVPRSPEEEELARFVSIVLADTEDVWKAQFQRELGQEYQEPTLVMFTQDVTSACGQASASMGPFYCPADGKVYIDLKFYDEMKTKFRAPGDFAQAYVIAHEVGHHVQNLMGISDQVHKLRGRVSEEEQNRASVRLELQADYLAGVWAHHAQKMRNILEEGDIEEALRCASAIGDDKLQKQARGYVEPDSFTHGTSEQRVRWFTKGFKSGKFRDAEQAFDLPFEQL